MTVELISVGTEILMGNIVNSNTQFLAEKCAMLGFDLFFQVTVGDNYDRMMSVVRQGLSRSDILILTGGLGPTFRKTTGRWPRSPGERWCWTMPTAWLRA